MEPVKTDERTIAQVITLLRGLVRIGKIDPPLGVAMVVGTSAEAAAWRREALDYLTARAEGLQYLPTTVDIGDRYDAG
jgi:hypothetical protein